MKVTDRLRKAITAADVNRRRISQEKGIQESALSRFIHGERGLDGTSIDKLATYFGLELKPKPKRKGR
jgi:transcriptional regulator with XRE-family HTH domain